MIRTKETQSNDDLLFKHEKINQTGRKATYKWFTRFQIVTVKTSTLIISIGGLTALVDT